MAILKKRTAISGDIRRHWAILGDIGRYWAILGDIGCTLKNKCVNITRFFCPLNNTGYITHQRVI